MPNKEETFFSKEFYFLIAMIAVTAVTVVPFAFTGFATGDDVQYYITANTQDIWAQSYNYAQGNGRFYFVFMMPIFYQWLPYIFDNFVATKMVNVSFIVLNYLLFALIIKEIFKNKWLAFLCYLIGMVFISIKGINNPIASYPIYFSLSFSLILYSLYCAIKFNDTQLRKYKTLSVIFFALGLLFYENYLIYLPLILGFIIYHQFKDSKKSLVLKLKRAFIIVLPYSIVVFVYLAAYIGWRLVFNQYQYSGAMIATHNSIWDFLNTITSISRGAYPLFFYFSEHSVFTENSFILENHEHGLPNVFLHAKIEWVFKAVIVSLLFFYIIQRVNLIEKRKVFYAGLIGVIFIYSPQFLLATTEKYMTLVKCCGITNYLTTYFSVFPVALLLGIILLIPVFLIPKEKFLISYKVFISVLIGLACVVNDYSNDHALTDLKNPLYTFQAFEELTQTKAFKAIPANSFIYAPQLYKENSEISTMFGQVFDWSDY
ncbi:MAG: hypothetical protein H7282_15315, partial [Cytophagaceae bacterium]|nr:hypothetical protein [Cytophagaceae bacterium]